ncbi:MAG: hypothetical protein N3B16_05795, partial [Candidatus Aminicenantes bacterium]|nr:hypothetical protein [Candidatus Aminicenantes bacterium]
MKKAKWFFEAKKENFESGVTMILEDAQGKRSIYSTNLVLRAMREDDLFSSLRSEFSMTYPKLREGRNEIYQGGSKEWDGFHLRPSRLDQARRSLHS